MKFIQPNDFDLNTALTLLDSTDDFPVDFDAAWQWLGYSRKDSAKRILLDNFVENLDFHISVGSDNHAGLSIQERAVTKKTEVIKLTLDCLKMLGMMAGTKKGKQVRCYFLECERKLKQLSSDPLLVQILGHYLTTIFEQRFVASEQRQLEARVHTKNNSERKLIAPLAAIVRRSQRVGAVDARDISHSVLIFRNVGANEIRLNFRYLADLGYGTCEGAGTKLRFTAYLE